MFYRKRAGLIAKTSMAVNVATTINNIRLFGAIVGGASLVLGPDSSALHFAAAFEVPALGFRGPFSPESRTRYYPNQIHLYHPELCPACPCYNYLPELPIGKCPRGAQQTSSRRRSDRTLSGRYRCGRAIKIAAIRCFMAFIRTELEGIIANSALPLNCTFGASINCTLVLLRE